MNQLFALTFLFFVGLASVNSQECEPDEVAVNCINLCNTCQIKGNCYDVCIPGCDCKQGYYRTSTGRCIKSSLCIYDSANHCPGFEFFVPCNGHCENDCKNKNEIVCHTGVCVSECRCYWGYVRGPNGTCITPKECPAKDDTKYPVPRVCPFNEHWDQSTAHCQENCTILGHPLPCPKISVAGCVCNKGHVRGNNGRCIPRSQCPKKAEDEILDQDELVDQAESFCPPHEFFVKCYANCESDCKNRNQTICARRFCVQGCKCVSGFVRGPKGTCIKPKECPPKDDTKYPVEKVCPVNEHWSTSLAHCQENCTNLEHPPPCPKIAVPGCVCIEGLYRGKDGKCIPRNQCPKTETDEILNQDELVDQASSFCPPNEFYVECYAHCENDCKNKNRTFCARQFCVSGCRCDWGFVRGPKGICIKPEKCPPKDDTIYPVKRVCPANEHWNPYRAHCQNNCTNIGKPIPCFKVAIGGCVCVNGFYRGNDGKCIKENECIKKAIEDLGFEGTFINPDEDEEERNFFDDEGEEKAHFQGEQFVLEPLDHGCPNESPCRDYCSNHGGGGICIGGRCFCGDH